MPNEILFFLLSRESFEERLLKLRLFKFEVLRNSRARLNFFPPKISLPFLFSLSLVTISLWPCSRLKSKRFRYSAASHNLQLQCFQINVLAMEQNKLSRLQAVPNWDSPALINIRARFHVNYKQNIRKQFIINKFIISGSFQMSFWKYIFPTDLFMAVGDDCNAKLFFSQNSLVLFTRNERTNRI